MPATPRFLPCLWRCRPLQRASNTSNLAFETGIPALGAVGFTSSHNTELMLATSGI